MQEIERYKLSVIVLKLALSGVFDSEDAIDISRNLIETGAVDWSKFPEYAKEAFDQHVYKA